ncbi:opioid growth factor receptor-like protein 1 isoform X1 [Tachysurus vachellii]|uniref:opioid growth factor receptor-like protein 1 isoform X1 n=2 Tax=Tachysurus vachellii TaxID=175792 RepID=UPI00296AD7EB|nr:opioid growth factor receptor-like protein 1 isoform X1 [Tachysurus vachellii]
MGVFRCVVKLLYQSLLFLFRLPRPVFGFISWLFGALGKFGRFEIQDRAMDYYGDHYDSTWEEDNGHEDTGEGSFSAHRNTYAAKDMQIFRRKSRKTSEHLKDWTDDMNDDIDLPNWRFYTNEKKFNPGGVYIDDFHSYWFGNYDDLEYVHSYIQWLFPIQEMGMNFASRELSLTEIKLFHEDDEVKKRLLTSYKLMLDFYGIRLVSEDTGEVERAQNWRKRFENLNRNTHNNLRITRILKCLGLLGFSHYQAPLVHFFLEETLVHDTLPRVKQSALDYFMFAVLDKRQRKELIRFAFWYFEPKDKFVWCPRSIYNEFLQDEGPPILKFSTSLSEGVSNDSTSQSDKNELKNSGVQNKDDAGTGEGTNNDKCHSSESRKDKNVSDLCQESEKPALPIPGAGNANMSGINENNKALSGVNSQHDSHIASESQATIQKDDGKARNEKHPNSEQKATEKSDKNGSDYAESSKQSEVLSGDKNFGNSTTSSESTNENIQTANHSRESENAAKETPLSGSEQRDQGDKLEKGNKVELISKVSGNDSKENGSEENQMSVSESPEDSVVTGSGTHNEANSDAHYEADMNSEKYTESEGSIVGNLQEGGELQSQENALKRTEEVGEKKKDGVNQSMEDSPIELSPSHAVTSNDNEYTDSGDVKDGENTESEPDMAPVSDVNSFQVIPGKDTETGEGKEEKSFEEEKTEIGCVKDGGNEQEVNIV